MALKSAVFLALFGRVLADDAACSRAEQGCQAEDEFAALQLTRDFNRGLLASGAAEASECQADKLPKISSGVLMDLNQAKPCIEKIVAPAHMAKQTVAALAEYYSNFYAFAAIAADPPAANYSFPEVFVDAGLKIFGAEGGGAPAEQSKVDLLGGLKALAASIPENGTYPVASWVAPTNDLFMGLRDVHVSWTNRGMPAASALNVFELFLLDEDFTTIKLTVSSASDDITVNGPATPVVKDRAGNVVESIAGEKPMRWLSKTFAEATTFAFPYKSIGARMNRLIDHLRVNLQDHRTLGNLGSLGGLDAAPIPVEIRTAAGSLSRTTWQWKVFTKTSSDSCSDFECVSSEVSHTLNRPGAYAKTIAKAAAILKRDWKSPSVPPQEEEEASLLGAARAAAGAGAAAAAFSAEGLRAPQQAAAAGDRPGRQPLPDDVFAWLPKPTETTSTYGLMAFRKGDDGSEFGVFKLTTFDLHGREAPPGWDVDIRSDMEQILKQMSMKFREFSTEAKRRGIDRLVVDVTGNGGGVTSLAWQFVQEMLSDLPFADSCGSVRRALPEAYNLWTNVNHVPLFEFIENEGLKVDRQRQVGNDTIIEAVVANAKALFTVAEELGLLSANEWRQVDQLGTNSTPAEALANLFDLAMDGWQAAGLNPFLGPDARHMQAWTEAYVHSETLARGGTYRNFTAPVSDCPRTQLPDNHTNPFKDIIFVSDGQCGSSCYIFAGTTWAVARKTGSRRVRIATYGGLGGESLEEVRQTMSGTSFPGGNVEGDGVDNMFKPVLKGLLIEAILADLIGSQEMLSQLRAVFEEMVRLVPSYSDILPSFTNSQLYQKVFGDNAPPAEYVFVPTDVYLPYWFSNVGGKRTAAWAWDLQQLELMWKSTAKAFGDVTQP